MLIHGPPKNILNEINKSEKINYNHLLKIVIRCKSRFHYFNYIHENWDIVRINWKTKAFEKIKIIKSHIFENRYVNIDISKNNNKPLK